MNKAIPFVATLLLTVGCSKQYTAKSMADDYLEQNAKEPSMMQHRNYLDLDSTKLLNDSIVMALRTYNHPRMNATGEPDVPAKAGRMLYVLPMKYYYNGEPERLTFYFDEQLQHIVAVK